MAAFIVGAPRSRLVGVVRGQPDHRKALPGGSPGSQRGAVGLRTDLDREQARARSPPRVVGPRRGTPLSPYAWRSRSVGFGRKLRCPFHTRLTTWAATSSFFMRLSSSHHCPTWAMSPTSICA